MCKDGYATVLVQPLFVAGNLFQDQFGFMSGAGSWLVLALLFGEDDTVNLGFSLCILSLFLVRIEGVVFGGSREEVPLSLPFNSFILGFSFFIVEELVFPEFLKKVGGFCRTEANPALSGASSADLNSRIK